MIGPVWGSSVFRSTGGALPSAPETPGGAGGQHPMPVPVGSGIFESGRDWLCAPEERSKPTRAPSKVALWALGIRRSSRVVAQARQAPAIWLSTIRKLPGFGRVWGWRRHVLWGADGSAGGQGSRSRHPASKVLGSGAGVR
jgi:hypothetical protein